MLILIAESKTMSERVATVTESEYRQHCPALEAGAEAIIDSLRGLTAGELAARLGLSLRLAAGLTRMVYDFADKSRGSAAITAYTGVVFKALDYCSLSEKAKEMCKKRVRIVASLYGWLKPDDLIKTYRLDYTAHAAPGGGTLAAFWKQDVTDCLTECLSSGGFTEILDLLPGDAAKFIDRKGISKDIKVWKPDFIEIQPGRGMKRPNASKLKTLRGSLLRQILTEGIDSVEEMKHLETEMYCFDSVTSEGSIVFHTV